MTSTPRPQPAKDAAMADQPTPEATVIVYISREGSEVSDLQDLVDGREDTLPWVGLRNGQEVPITVRLADPTSDRDEDEHDAQDGDEQDGTSGQDRDSYTDDQDRDHYTV